MRTKEQAMPEPGYDGFAVRSSPPPVRQAGTTTARVRASDTGGGAVPAVVRAQMLATGHWGLLATRSMTWAEVLGRIAAHLTMTSAGLVSLALVVQVSGFCTAFRALSISISGAVLLLGTLTMMRVGDRGRRRPRPGGHTPATSTLAARSGGRPATGRGPGARLSAGPVRPARTGPRRAAAHPGRVDAGRSPGRTVRRRAGDVRPATCGAAHVDQRPSEEYPRGVPS
ncbi:hypothetical protein [Georgenia sp. AZ-5]|uniref:hypothetical protein n=1 Tax=Georgenia sp. AZ-5 TaxID=3367526 RepID=UPI0037546F0E